VTTAAFEDASAIVSGGAGGLGEATVRRLHAEGLAVVIADLAEAKGKELANELGSRATFVSTDVTSEESVLGAIDTANSLGTLRYAVVAHGGWVWRNASSNATAVQPISVASLRPSTSI